MSAAPAATTAPRDIFMSTGEPSGDMVAAQLAEAMRRHDPALRFSGIGGERMRAQGFTITQSTLGIATMGPLSALGKIPLGLVVFVRHLWWLVRSPRALIVFVDFGGFNLRFARALRALGYDRPMLYFLPPGAWLDQPERALAVAAAAHPLTAFEHQRDFYRSLGLEIAYFGHPLASLIQARPPRPPAPADGGTLALLPGSRSGEIAHHLPRLLAAAAAIARERPKLDIVLSAADSAAEREIRRAGSAALGAARIVRGAQPALDAADVALVSSGTAVLEAALRAVPCVALYVVSVAQAKIGRRMYRGTFVTLPNLMLNAGVIPELIQEDATVENLAANAVQLLADPSQQLARLADLRERLGPPDALDRCAAYALSVAG